MRLLPTVLLGGEYCHLVVRVGNMFIERDFPRLVLFLLYSPSTHKYTRLF